jgi:hypothetical protein
MADSDPLLEWNRLNKINAENALTSAMFSSLISTSPIIDRFSAWLLAGTGATAALLVANADKLVPFLGEAGFRVCGALLVVSAIFGLISKARAVQCQIGIENDQRVRELMRPVLDKHAQDEEKILELSNARSIKIETEVDFERVIAEFAKPFPRWVGWLLGRHLAKHAGDPQIGYLLPIRFYSSQCFFAFLQVVSFLVFVCAALLFAQEGG